VRWLKWVVLVLVLAGLAVLASDYGVDRLHARFVEGAEDETPKANESKLTHLGNFLLKTFRYERAEEVLEDALRLYPEGENQYYNQYLLSLVKEELGKAQETVELLEPLIENNVHQELDERVPEKKVLELRRNRLVRDHELARSEG
jgi:tetratricopeptide (TPR) repeat protein